MATRSGGFGVLLRTHYEIGDDRVVITYPTRRWWVLTTLAAIGGLAVVVGVFGSSARIGFPGFFAAMGFGWAPLMSGGWPPPARIECSREGVRWGRRMIPADEIEDIGLRDERVRSVHHWRLEIKKEYQLPLVRRLASPTITEILVEPKMRALGDAIVAIVRRPAVTAP
jgi:hypothetical protein